jgi:hypothetical protein
MGEIREVKNWHIRDDEVHTALEADTTAAARRKSVEEKDLVSRSFDLKNTSRLTVAKSLVLLNSQRDRKRSVISYSRP